MKRAAATAPTTLSEAEVQALRDRLSEAEDTIDAFRHGAVDAVVVTEAAGSQVYSLTGADLPYRVYVERMQEGAVTVSSDGTILFCNARFAEMLGSPLEQVIATSMTAYLSAEAWTEISRVFTGDGLVVKHQTSLICSGTAAPLQVLLSASELPLPAQKVICLVVTDLHDQVENARLRIARDLAESKNQAKDNFLAVLSHELRTPLTPVLMAITSMEDKPGLPPEVRETLAMMKRNIDLETKLIDDLLDINGIVTGKLRLELEPMDLNHALRQVCAMCLSQAEDKGVGLVVTNDASLRPVAADPSRLHQVLWNVLKNAIKFTPAGGAITVWSEALPGGGCAVHVKDSGIGIPQESLGRIFDAFEQGSSGITRRFGGLGLGLAISKALISLHGGVIQAASEGDGKGATFTIKLPSSTLPEAANPAHVEPEAHEEHTSLRLLLVEDHEDTARVLGGLLKASGYVVLSADSVASAVDVAKQEPFDLLVSDLGLPDGDGYEIMNRIRALRTVPGIAMSGFGMDEDVRRSSAAGFNEHLVKPIDVPRLLAAIQRVTARK